MLRRRRSGDSTEKDYWSLAPRGSGPAPDPLTIFRRVREIVHHGPRSGINRRYRDNPATSRRSVGSGDRCSHFHRAQCSNDRVMGREDPSPTGIAAGYPRSVAPRVALWVLLYLKECQARSGGPAGASSTARPSSPRLILLTVACHNRSPLLQNAREEYPTGVRTARRRSNWGRSDGK